jgi:hypothetical protein
MLSERKKARLILFASLGALLMDIVIFLGPTPESYYRLLHSIYWFDWGWVPAFGLGVIAITCTVRWKPGGLKLRLFVLFISIIAVIFALLWYFTSNLLRSLGS